MYLSDIPKYRDTIMEQICKCDTIINLIRPEDRPNMKTSELAYQYIFPYGRIIDKTADVGTYLCFDIVAPRVVNRAFTDFRINFWLIAHDRRMQTPKGLVTDLLSIEVEKIMNGSKAFGLGSVELMTWDRFTPAESFNGRSLMYRTVDFNRE